MMVLFMLRRCLAPALILLTTTSFAAAQEERVDLISFGAGVFDILDDDKAADFRLEYRPDLPFLIDTSSLALKPFVGLEATSDAAVYGLGGILLDWFIGERVVVTGSFGVGAFADGDGKDLGNTIEFRSQIEAGYRFSNDARLTAAFGHISNASLGDDNPGTEIATVYLHLPLRLLTGN